MRKKTSWPSFFRHSRARPANLLAANDEMAVSSNVKRGHDDWGAPRMTELIA
jgi:hypothetical protein